MLVVVLVVTSVVIWVTLLVTLIIILLMNISSSINTHSGVIFSVINVLGAGVVSNDWEDWEDWDILGKGRIGLDSWDDYDAGWLRK